MSVLRALFKKASQLLVTAFLSSQNHPFHDSESDKGDDSIATGLRKNHTDQRLHAVPQLLQSAGHRYGSPCII